MVQERLVALNDLGENKGAGAMGGLPLRSIIFKRMKSFRARPAEGAQDKTKSFVVFTAWASEKLPRSGVTGNVVEGTSNGARRCPGWPGSA